MDEQTPAVVAEEVPPQDQVATAAPESESTPEEAKPAAKTFTQEEVDELISKRLAREQRKWERKQVQQPAAASPKDVPPVDSFESPEAYAEALATKKAEELVAKRDTERRQAEVLEAYQDREEQAREKYDDFEQVAYNPNLRITNVMAETIQASDVGPDVAYYLGSNPKEADRISRLSPFLQAKEIGKIEAKLASDPPVKKTTAAPQPITPVSARTVGSPAYDTTDPRSIKQMTTSQWIEAERQRQMKKLQAQSRI